MTEAEINAKTDHLLQSSGYQLRDVTPDIWEYYRSVAIARLEKEAEWREARDRDEPRYEVRPPK